MGKGMMIGIIIVLILLLYFFYPLCNFKTIGSSFPSDDGCNTCQCSFIGTACTEMACLDDSSCGNHICDANEDENTCPADCEIIERHTE